MITNVFFTNMHEIFFVDFLNVLVEWIQRFFGKIRRYHTKVPRNWIVELIQQVNTISNKVSHEFDYWLDNVLRGYVIEFGIDCTQSYSVVEREFFKGPCEIFLNSIST
jgi:hypothetical protein